MSSKYRMSKEQIEDLLTYLDVSKMNQWKGNKIQFTCPVHGESNPSCGINIDYRPEGKFNDSYQVFHCFSCNAGGSIPWLVFKSLPDKFHNVKQASKFLQERYGVSYSYSFDPTTSQITRYEERGVDLVEPRFELPMSRLAPYRSGKETYQYFFNRGFDKEDMKKFQIGRDLENETVTIPSFWEDGKLAGLIGRYIDPNRPKNMRFMIYSFPKGSLIYPLDKLQVLDGTIIGVESMFDCIALHKWGFPNTISIMGNGMSKQQAEQIRARCRVFVDLFDSDERGREARNTAKKKLGSSVVYMTPTYYPERGKDPLQWGELETLKVLRSATYFGSNNIPRL